MKPLLEYRPPRGVSRVLSTPAAPKLNGGKPSPASAIVAAKPVKAKSVTKASTLPPFTRVEPAMVTPTNANSAGSGISVIVSAGADKDRKRRMQTLVQELKKARYAKVNLYDVVNRMAQVELVALVLFLWDDKVKAQARKAKAQKNWRDRSKAA
jgi:hypothetical protein